MNNGTRMLRSTARSAQLLPLLGLLLHPRIGEAQPAGSASAATATPPASADPSESSQGDLASPPVTAPLAADPSPGANEIEEELELRLRRFSDALARGVERLGTHPRYLNLAVLPFEEHGVRTNKHQLGLLISHSVGTAMARDYGLRLVPPAAIREALEQQPKGQAIEPATARALGQAVRASVVILGNVSDAGDHFAISASVLAVSGRQEPLEHRLLRIPAAELLDAAEDARILRTRWGALWRSSLLPGWGQWYNRQQLKGTVITALEVGLLATAITFEVLGYRAEERYEWGLRRTSADREQAHTAYLTGNILFTLAASLWLYGALDAYLNGADPDATPTLITGVPSFELQPWVLTGSSPLGPIWGAATRIRF